MNFLSATALSKSYGTKSLFDDLTFGIEKGQKIALVGRNGCGKSTLLRILAGQEASDKGEVSQRAGIRNIYLPQNPTFGEASTILEAVFSGDNPAMEVIRRYEELSQHAHPDPKKMQAAIDDMEASAAWDMEHRAKEILGKLGLDDLGQPLAELSGGQHKRVALAQALVSEPDLLLLDEPTNHLDTDTIEWLEDFLAAKAVTLILVTHDRYFLDRVCNEVVELDQGGMYRYKGDYEHFLEKKQERQAAGDTDSVRAQNLLRKELEWLKRQPKARTTKSKARIDAAHELMERGQAPTREQDISINFQSRRMGGKILELHRVSKAYGDLRLIDKFDYVFKKGERIGIVGPNGVGKTTFLSLITEELDPDSGRISTGETIRFGYYAQHGMVIKEEQRVIGAITEIAEEVVVGKGEKLKASSALNLFGFPPKMQQQFVSSLSGGEKRRLFLLRVLMDQPNFLILDEPTNDLDLITLNTLEDFLMGFQGCLLIVSHDRYFLDKLCDHLFIFEGEGVIKPFPGTFRQYREQKAKEDKAKGDNVQKPEFITATTRQDQKQKDNLEKKLSFKETREYEQLESEIPRLEQKKADLLDKLNAGSENYKDLEAWAADLRQLEQELEAKGDRWLELAERMSD